MRHCLRSLIALAALGLAPASAGEIASPPAGYPDCAAPGARDYRLIIETPGDVYDGDTVKARLCTRDVLRLVGAIDRGEVCTASSVTLRLFGHNAFEVRGDERIKGLAARDWLRARIHGANLRGIPIDDGEGGDKRGKYGRVLMVVCDGAADVSAEMVAAGLSRWWDY